MNVITTDDSEFIDTDVCLMFIADLRWAMVNLDILAQACE